MILIDYSGIAMSVVFTQLKTKVELDSLRHMILNTLRMYNVKYRRDYGKLIICCDDSSWRKRVFKEYKASRNKNREESDIDWTKIFEYLAIIQDEIQENMPYPVVRCPGAEADDIIAVLVESTQEFGNHENVMIISADKDFLQLQQYANVKQYSPMTKKLLVEKNPKRFIMEHVLRGDSSDGVPNVLSPDNTFTDKIRQKPVRKKFIEETIEKLEAGEDLQTIFEDSDVLNNYARNKIMIDLSCIPDDIKDAIKEAYTKACDGKTDSKILNYLIKNNCQLLVGSASDFFTKP